MLAPVADAALLIAGVFLYIMRVGVAHPAWEIAVMCLLFTYVLLSVYGKPVRQWYRIKLTLLLLLFASTTLLSMASEMRLRLQGQPHTHIHDHPLQIEEAVKVLLQGRNPYAADYHGTAMELWSPSNPALTHVISPPFNILKSVPFYLLGTRVLGWYDERMVYFPLLGLAIVSLLALFRQPQLRLSAVIVFAFNPEFTRFVVEGRTDVVFLSFLLASLACLRWQYTQAALLLLALAITSKHTAWFILPFFAAYLAATGYFRQRALRKVLPFFALTGAIVLPFFLWDTQAFLDDIYRYAAGTLPTSYPINGFGLGMTLHRLGVIPSIQQPFPPVWLQLILLPWLGWLMADTYRRPGMGRMLLNYGMFLWSFWYLSRFFHDNYLGVLITIVSLGVLMTYEQPKLRPQAAKKPAKRPARTTVKRPSAIRPEHSVNIRRSGA